MLPQSLPVLTYIRRDGEICENNKKTQIKRIPSTSSNETISSCVSIFHPMSPFNIIKKMFGSFLYYRRRVKYHCMRPVNHFLFVKKLKKNFQAIQPFFSVTEKILFKMMHSKKSVMMTYNYNLLKNIGSRYRNIHTINSELNLNEY